MSEVLNQDLTELIVLPEQSADLTQLFATEGALNPFARIIHDAVADFTGDASTDKGRKEIKKIGAMINKSRDFIDNKGKEIVAELKDMPKRIDANRKAFRDDIDALRALKIQPLTDYENSEKARIDGLKELLNAIVVSMDQIIAIGGIDVIEKEINNILSDSTDWQDIVGDAEATKMQLIKRLNTRKEQLIQQEKETQERIAREVEAQKLKAEQEAKAKAEAEVQAKLKTEQNAINAEKAKAQAEIDAQNAEIARQKAEIETQRQIEANEAQKKLEAEQKAESEKLAREADVENRKRVNNEIKDALEFLGLDDALAMEVVKAMVKDQIPNITVNY